MYQFNMSILFETVMKVYIQDTGMWSLATVPSQTATEKVEENDVSETKESKSLGISLLGAPFFAAPSIFGQTFPTFTAKIRDTRRLNIRRGSEPLHTKD